MASDLSAIFKNELSNTLEQLLGKKASVSETKKFETIDSSSFVECEVKFDFSSNSTGIVFYLPSASATKFEYLMLGGMGDLKSNVDDETVDAINEIVSNICGSFCTASNAQALNDVSNMKSEVKNTKIVDGKILDSKNDSAFLFKILLDNEEFFVVLYFDKTFLPFFSSITGVVGGTKKTTEVNNTNTNTVSNTNQQMVGIANPSKNLELLYNVKLKLSVRLGTKIVLLKDILRWDVGEIIELEQMVNEPLELLINGVKIGEGEAVIVEGKFGLKIKRIVSEDLKLDKIGL